MPCCCGSTNGGYAKRELQRRLPGKTSDEIALWAIRQPGYKDLFDELAGKVDDDYFGEPFSWFRWLHHLEPPLHLPEGTPTLERARAMLANKERAERDVPPEIKTEFQELVVAAVLELAVTEFAAEKPDDAVPAVTEEYTGHEVPMPKNTVLEVIKLVLEKDLSALKLEAETETRDELKFINKNKTGVIRKWVKTHLGDAREAVDRHTLPADFRDTGDGVLMPKL